MEYPFARVEALAREFSCDEDVERNSQEAKERFSLLNGGVLERTSCSLHLSNEVEDKIFLLKIQSCCSSTV